MTFDILIFEMHAFSMGFIDNVVCFEKLNSIIFTNNLCALWTYRFMQFLQRIYQLFKMTAFYSVNCKT